MSRIKSILLNIDQTDIRDTGNYGQPVEPSASDWAIAGLNNDIGTLEQQGALGYVRELKEYRKRLQVIIDNEVKPF